ncbi:carbohydrate kinase family protein [Murimonas intestini]|nr:carbohydrate kinase [Murimonas intestini]MCR1841368.1 carbohydrate kinase [Murimonas intestini]
MIIKLPSGRLLVYNEKKTQEVPVMDVICVGEMLIDFTPGTQPASYIRNPGGAPANACIAMARNGLEAGFLGKLGDDDFGRFLKETLEKDGVKVLCPKLTDEAITTLAFVTLYENGERSFTFARKPGADMLLEVSDVKAEDIENTRMLHAGSFGMSKDPSRTATEYAMKLAKEKGKLVSYDVNYRDTVWENEAAAKEAVDSILKYVDLLKISEEELSFTGGEENIPAFMKENGITVVIETLGADGAKYFFDGREGHICGHKVKAVDATGAGDAFWGGFLSKILMSGVNTAAELTEDIVRESLEYGNASGAICVQKMGGIPALPTKAEIEGYLD